MQTVDKGYAPAQVLRIWGAKRRVVEKYRGLDLNLFVVFDALLRHRNVSRAAQSLGRSQSAVSHALSRLREHFGDELFIKTNEGVIATDRALELEDAVSQFVRHAEAALVRQAAFDPTQSTRRITLSISDMGELTVLPGLLAHLRRKAPNCTLRTVSVWGEPLEEMLAAGEIDLAISGPLKLSANVMQQKVFEHPWTVIAPMAAPFGDRISLTELGQAGHVVVTPTASDRYTIDALLEDRGVRRQAVISTPHFLSVPHLVAWSTNCIAVVPLHLARLHQNDGLVRVLTPDFELPKIQVTQYWHRRANRDPLNSWLRASIRDLLSGERAGLPVYPPTDGS